MKNRRTLMTPAILRLLIALAIAGGLSAQTAAQTPGGTSISNQASATYSDGTNSYSTVSNTVTVTVSNVSGLAITPDAGTNSGIVAGQTGVIFNFTVTNTGNFSDKVHFVPGSAHLSGTSPATNEVRTVSASSVNGQREARGDISASVIDDALLKLTLTAPTGPVPVGSDITYTWQVCNTGSQAASGVTLNGSTQVYIIVPIP